MLAAEVNQILFHKPVSYFRGFLGEILESRSVGYRVNDTVIQWTHILIDSI